jgi:hypothetical protein
MVECTGIYASIIIVCVGVLFGPSIWANVVSTVGLDFTKKSFDITEKRFHNEYPIPNSEHLHSLFSSFREQIVAPDNEIPNIEMENEITKVIDDALRFKGIYLLYGENGIGKSIALQKILRNRTSIHYVYIKNGMKGLPKLLSPNFNKESKFDIFETIMEALNHYSDFRKAQNLKGILYRLIVQKMHWL